MKTRAAAAALFFITPLCITVHSQIGAPQNSSPSNTPYVRPNAETRERRWLLGMFGPFAIGGDAFAAAFSTWSNKPPEWGKNWNGFGKRFASELGKGVIKGTTAYALEETFKLDSYYYRSPKHTQPGSRLKNALVSSFTARTPSGKRVLGFPKIAGDYSSSIIATKAWYPQRLGIRDGLRGGTWAVASDILSNLFTEFFHN